MRYYRKDYDDYSWYLILLGFEEGLPSDYLDTFGDDGEPLEKYQELFNLDIYESEVE
tara:strand:- start:218 stop:388 length:171 start_codon:yes stop_codon:yes gene_type:complete